MEIRRAREDDLQALLAIYNYEVENGTATFDIEPASEDARRQWLRAHNRENHPLFVAVVDGEVAGYISLSAFSAKPAYSGTVELSVYVAPGHRGQGVGRRLMEHVIAWARGDAATHLLVSIITAGNEASVRMHESFGFRHCGTLHEAGWKFGGWLDVDYYELKV